MSKLAALRQRLGALIAGKPAARGQRMYHGAKQSRLTQGWSSTNSSADAEMATSLRVLRGRSRSLVRDNSYAKRARDIVVNNVIGTGIGLQGQVGTTRGGSFERINSAIEDAWKCWSKADECHTGGTMHFADIERFAMAQVFESGECFIRIHRKPFGRSKVPMALELIEPERIADEYTIPRAGTGNTIRMGVECDVYGRPVAYFVRDMHDADIQYQFHGAARSLIRVPAEDILHLRIVDRWPQTRGVPWLHTAMRRLNDMDGYSEAEIVAARASASVVGFIKSPEAPVSDNPDDTLPPEMALEPGSVTHLAPGEDFVGFNPSRPNAAMDPFMRLMLREVASGCGVSYESLSRDYSQSNYSSSRLSMLDDRDTWRVLQAWFIRSFRERLHTQWLQAAVMSRAIGAIDLMSYALNPEKFEAVTWKPRGWTWVDPTKEVAAYKEAIKAGFTTVTQVIAATAGGADVEDVIAQRKRELALFDAADIDLDTTVPEPVEPAEAMPAAGTKPGAAAAAQDDSADPADDGEDSTAAPADTSSKAARVVSLARTA